MGWRSLHGCTKLGYAACLREYWAWSSKLPTRVMDWVKVSTTPVAVPLLCYIALCMGSWWWAPYFIVVKPSGDGKESWDTDAHIIISKKNGAEISAFSHSCGPEWWSGYLDYNRNVEFRSVYLHTVFEPKQSIIIPRHANNILVWQGQWGCSYFPCST